jgi:DNA-binding transcriptional regulator YiaG
MPNIASILKEEITRLARKELRTNTETLRKQVSAYRSEIAKLKRRVEELERQKKKAATATPAKADNDEAGDRSLRFRPAGFAKHRQRLGLSAREMGLLVNASPISVYKWEQGQARPRTKHLEAIASIRKLGKREAAARLEQLGQAT